MAPASPKSGSTSSPGTALAEAQQLVDRGKQQMAEMDFGSAAASFKAATRALAGEALLCMRCEADGWCLVGVEELEPRCAVIPSARPGCLSIEQLPCSLYPAQAGQPYSLTGRTLWEESLLDLAQCQLNMQQYDACVDTCTKFMAAAGE